MATEWTTVGVIGLGTMGAGIVEVFARAGIAVVAVEVSDDALARGRAVLTRSTDRAVAKGRLSESDRDALHARVTFASGLAALANVDLVIEAVPERLSIKRELFAELDRICQPGTVLATNTSSLSVTDIAVATGRPGRVIGVHFFNPAPVMKLVEIVHTVVTDADVLADVQALVARLGKTGVTIGDRAGFIANFLLFGYLNQAIGMLDSGYASREDIDAAMKVGCGLPMGPFALLDLIGLDTSVQILDTMYARGGRDRRHSPAPLLREMVTAGLLGRKSGRGFYQYDKPGSGAVVDAATPTVVAAAPASVGIVGPGPLASRLTAALIAAGYQDGAAAGKTVVVATDTLDALAGCDLVIDAAGGDAAAVQARFAALDKVVKPGATLASSSNAVPVIAAAMATARPADVVGLQLPAPANPLVEIITTVHSSDSAVSATRALAVALDKTVVTCGDRAGNIVFALLMPYLNDAVRMIEANYAGADDIDHAMTLGCGYPLGPIALLDHVGLDTALGTLRRLHAQTGEPGLSPAPLLEQMVTAGRRGARSGQGFRTHTPA